MKRLKISKVFPKGHPREGEVTGFKDAILCGKKIHTFRKNKSKKYKDGMLVSLCELSEASRKSKSAVILRDVKIRVEPATIQVRDFRLASIVIGQENIKYNIQTVLANDGLDGRNNEFDFICWFFPRKPKDAEWKGSCIYFDYTHIPQFPKENQK